MFKKFISLLAVVALAVPTICHGLAGAAAPTKIQIPFANGAGGAYVRTVPVPSQIGIQNGAASYTDGFPPLNFTPVNAGGVPPFGADMNGVLRDVSAHARWWAAGGPVYYDGTYQTAIGGYPGGAIVQSATVTGKLWVSIVDNNLTNPDTGGAGWIHPNSTVYAPLTGTGASGTWGINITGNAATANSATSATNATNATNATHATTASTCSDEIGVGQTWTDTTFTRVLNTRYTNSTARPIQVAVSVSMGSTAGSAVLQTANETVSIATTQGIGTGVTQVLGAIIPAGGTYYVLATGTAAVYRWAELR